VTPAVPLKEKGGVNRGDTFAMVKHAMSDPGKLILISDEQSKAIREA
jgi:hypothetical protein